MLENHGEVFLRLRQAGLKLKAKKCNLFAKRVSYLGHIISQDGIATDKTKNLKIQCPFSPSLRVRDLENEQED
jgi:hypothetical protein